MKKLNPAVRVDDTWEQVRPRLEQYDEYHVLESDELRRSAFDKHIRRLKEKEEDDLRSKERDYRNGSSHKRHRTATPEQDAYEADRRKAQAARERTYTKRGIPGVSPPPRERVRDWDSAGDRYEPSRGDSKDGRERERKVSTSNHYDRDRRDREAERERTYLSRADPKERTTVLEYGDEEGEVRPSTASRRGRRDSDVESTRSSKVSSGVYYSQGVDRYIPPTSRLYKDAERRGGAVMPRGRGARRYELDDNHGQDRVSPTSTSLSSVSPPALKRQAQEELRANPYKRNKISYNDLVDLDEHDISESERELKINACDAAPEEVRARDGESEGEEREWEEGEREESC
jgi:hypothetical protein